MSIKYFQLKNQESKYSRTIDPSWDFRGANTKEFTHSYHMYPAVMIPQVARKLLKEYRPEGKFDLVFDPYMGSGTTLVEASIIGVNAIGTDLNPLARLISKSKTTYYNIENIKKDFSILQNSIHSYHKEVKVTRDTSNITKIDYWYSPEVVHKLSYLSEVIDNNISSANKSFFLIALSEIIRECSFTRNGEFKRYKMNDSQLLKFNPKPFELFHKKIVRNIQGLRSFIEKTHGKKSIIKIDSFNTVEGIPDYIQNSSIDMIVTSPPYGDSKTTVAYGQYSRWASEWFNFENAKKIDHILMGGRKLPELSFQTNSISDELQKINTLDPKRYYEVCYFLEEYYKSICNISIKVRDGGIVCFVVGNRRVKGVQISLDKFTAEMFELNGFSHVKTIVRDIPNKRMPSKTSPSNKKGAGVKTMSNEYIVICQK